jgi:hypothetical protein
MSLSPGGAKERLGAYAVAERQAQSDDYLASRSTRSDDT